ncbi:FecR family protein [Sphingobacterium multivorum]|uniref:FecR family protein n=1 Tax=Sphingobacterium multivorum TaxID=28454 RepID=UPI0028AA8408|nr:FecR family protein [Sphingobacterium multivorum]
MEYLLQRYIEGRASREECEIVFLWIEADASHRQQYESLRALYTASIWSEDELEKEVAMEELVAPKKSRIYPFLRFAALFLLSLSVLLNVKHYVLPDNGRVVDEKQAQVLQQVKVPAGQRVNLILADGTQVWLNANSSFSFPGNFSGVTRDIYLDGEARFVVTHNEKQPFIVHTKTYDVKVLGTDFNVRAYDRESKFETALLSGKVNILDKKGGEHLLKPGQRAISQDGKFAIEPIVNLDYYRWKDGLICFENKPIQELLKDMESLFGVKIINTNVHLNRQKYTGKFWMDDGLEHILRVLSLNGNFTFRRDYDKNEYTIQ